MKNLRKEVRFRQIHLNDSFLMKKRFIGFLLAWLALPANLLAQDTSYDRYAPIWEEAAPPQSEENLKTYSNHFLIYPFELVKWPADQTLIFIEKEHLYDKAKWIYEQMKNHGFKPHVRSLFGGGSFGGGFDLEMLQLVGLKEKHPNLTVEGSALWTFDSITEYRVKLLQEQIGGTGFKVGSNLKYENRGEEHFYGIGPDTSLGDGTSYRLERTTLDALLGASTFLNVLDVEAKFSYQNANITNGEDGGRGIIDEIFVKTGRQTIPGLAGDQILSWAIEMVHDSRDNEDVPTQGGYEKFHFSFNKGLENQAGFFKYRGEAAHFFKIFTERRVLALRGLIEHNDELGDRDVPFFMMARLGGFGAYPRVGDTFRAYRRDRFYDESLLLFNAEYRWTVWEYRDWRMDQAIFWDFGQVFGEFNNFQFEDFRSSYGVGFRISHSKKVLLAIEMAGGSEGMQFYAKTSTPF